MRSIRGGGGGRVRSRDGCPSSSSGTTTARSGLMVVPASVVIVHLGWNRSEGGRYYRDPAAKFGLMEPLQGRKGEEGMVEGVRDGGW